MAAEVGGMSDERLCTVCNGRQMIFVQGPNASHPCEHCRGTGIEPATPSTDEGEARWERMEESPDYVVWRKRWAEGYSESSAVPKAIEAAIRAPLDAEVERLREALRRCRREALLNWGSPSVSERVVLHVGAVLPATPPSSTEGTNTTLAQEGNEG